ncbi:hypothetical protein [Adhaeretor mobilis]|uniref:PEP-CTERM protein-sorting domain-containing protein n=1 Tax=Adhaeretor mobilis TaxID=1930276 RepID=A0A517N1J1_9BACT|nr:hypothetical protein [Adhaeretor mobilis]QDT01009.1 hypothetical protein HG15A2_43510 [Adhaeretor mobilis]
MYRLTFISLLLAIVVDPASATLVVSTDEVSSGSFAIAVTTDQVFDAIEIGVNGDVGNGVNIVPISPTTMGQNYVSSSPSFTLLSALGTNLEADGVFEPGLNFDLDLTYGVTSPVPGQWTSGLSNALFLHFDLVNPSAIANVTVNLYNGSPTPFASETVQAISAIPEASSVVVWSLLSIGVLVAGLSRNFRGCANRSVAVAVVA